MPSIYRVICRQNLLVNRMSYPVVKFWVTVHDINICINVIHFERNEPAIAKWKMKNLSAYTSTALCVYYNDTKCCSHISFTWLRRIEAIQWVKWVCFFLSHITQTIEYYVNACQMENKQFSLQLIFEFGVEFFAPFLLYGHVERRRTTNFKHQIR